MNYYMFLMLLMPLFSMMALIMQQSHFLMTLLSLEAITLTLVLYLSMAGMVSNMYLPTMSVMILSFSACEASFGLSLLVIMARNHGTDLMKSLSANKC